MSRWTSDEYWDQWEQAFVAELEDRDLKVDDVIELDEIWGDIFGHLGYGDKSIKSIVNRNHLGEPPAPLFTIWRKHFWLRSEMLDYLAPALKRREDAQRNREARQLAKEARSTAFQARMYETPVGQSGYRHVAKHPSGTWHAFITIDGKQISGGYLRSVEDAARCSDYLRWQHGYAPINFPDDFNSVTLPKRDLWEMRLHGGPRGITDKIIEALRGRHLTTSEVYAAVEHMDTTRDSVSVSLVRLAKEGRIQRVEWGVYTA